MTKLNGVITFVLQFSKTGFSLKTSHSCHHFYNGFRCIRMCLFVYGRMLYSTFRMGSLTVI